MARPTGEGGSAANGKKRASATKKPRGPSAKRSSSKRKAAGGAKGKARRRASDDQIANQLKVVKGIKARLKELASRFEEAYPEGLDFAPTSNDADFA